MRSLDRRGTDSSTSSPRSVGTRARALRATRGPFATSDDERLGCRLMIEFGFSHCRCMHVERCSLEPTRDVGEVMVVAGERELRPMGVGAEHGVTASGLEGQHQKPIAVDYPPQLGEGVVEAIRRRVDDRVPAHDTVDGSVPEGEFVQATLLELDRRMGPASRFEHRPGHVETDDVEPMGRKEGGHPARSASDISNPATPARGDQFDERGEQRSLDRSLRRSADLGPGELHVLRGRNVVDRAGCCDVIFLRHPPDPRGSATVSALKFGALRRHDIRQNTPADASPIRRSRTRRTPVRLHSRRRGDGVVKGALSALERPIA